MFTEYKLCKARIRALEAALAGMNASATDDDYYRDRIGDVYLALWREKHKLVEMQAIYIFMAIAIFGTVLFMVLCAWSGASLANGITTQIEFAMSLVRNAFSWIGFVFLSIFVSAWFQNVSRKHIGRQI